MSDYIFPQPDIVRLSEYDSPGVRQVGGMTLRQYFAGLAMQGVLASDVEDELEPRGAAVAAVRCADALIAVLKETET